MIIDCPHMEGWQASLCFCGWLNSGDSLIGIMIPAYLHGVIINVHDATPDITYPNFISEIKIRVLKNIY